MAQDERILTPEEMYQTAYKRNIIIGNMWLKAQPKPEWSYKTEYKFDFDQSAIYKFTDNLPDEGALFTRVSDGARAIFTKYSHITFNK